MYKFFNRNSYYNHIFELSPRSTLQSYNTRFESDIFLTSVWTNVTAKLALYKGVKFYNGVTIVLKCVSDYEKIKRELRFCKLTNQLILLTAHDVACYVFIRLFPLKRHSLTNYVYFFLLWLFSARPSFYMMFFCCIMFMVSLCSTTNLIITDFNQQMGLFFFVCLFVWFWG